MASNLHRSDDDSMDIDDVVVANDVNSQEALVKLTSKDGKKFTLTKAEAKCSNTLRAMLEFNCDDSHLNDSIMLNNINGILLSNIVEWCKNHSSDWIDTNSSILKATDIELSDWDKQFLNSLKHEELLMLMHAANYLDVRTLFNACCQIVAKSWEGKKVDEIRKMYKIEGDQDEEEEHQLFLESKKLGLEN